MFLALCLSFYVLVLTLTCAFIVAISCATNFEYDFWIALNKWVYTLLSCLIKAHVKETNSKEIRKFISNKNGTKSNGTLYQEKESICAYGRHNGWAGLDTERSLAAWPHRNKLCKFSFFQSIHLNVLFTRRVSIWGCPSWPARLFFRPLIVLACIFVLTESHRKRITGCRDQEPGSASRTLRKLKATVFLFGWSSTMLTW